MNITSLFIWNILGLMMIPAANAQIIADPTAPGTQRPTVLKTANGIPLVNIQTPSAAGVSHNTYRQFDVQQPGAILNNSRTNVKTGIGGYVQGNPWLAKGSARVILTNPSGITCDGCGFINAHRVTLTTGTPTMNHGNLEGYRVQGGAVTITGLGLDSRTADYTDIITRAVQINAGIWADHLKIVTRRWRAQRRQPIRRCGRSDHHSGRATGKCGAHHQQRPDPDRYAT